MSDAPVLKVIKGNATPEEAAAIEAAVLKIWREQQARAARDRGLDPWLLAARIEQTKRGQESLARAGRSWRLGGRIAATPVSNLHPGRGDAR